MCARLFGSSSEGSEKIQSLTGSNSFTQGIMMRHPDPSWGVYRRRLLSLSFSSDLNVASRGLGNCGCCDIADTGEYLGGSKSGCGEVGRPGASTSYASAQLLPSWRPPPVPQPLCALPGLLWIHPLHSPAPRSLSILRNRPAPPSPFSFSYAEDQDSPCQAETFNQAREALQIASGAMVRVTYIADLPSPSFTSLFLFSFSRVTPSNPSVT